MVNLTRSALEEALMMRSWGYWGRDRGASLGYSVPAWTKQVIAGYRDERNPPPPITDDYGMQLENLMRKLDEVPRKILFMTYVLQQPRQVVRREIGRSSSSVDQALISALSYLYGRLMDGAENLK